MMSAFIPKRPVEPGLRTIPRTAQGQTADSFLKHGLAENQRVISPRLNCFSGIS
jgi:hypothetical protein